MTPEFSEAVDPIFLEVLGLLERIGQKESASLQEERMRIRNCFHAADGRLGTRIEWELAKYALVCWIDELLCEVAWEHRKVWQEQVLEKDLFNSRERFWKFYVRAEDAARLPQRDALEVYYICVVLGFQGLYRPQQNAEEESAAHSAIQEYHLPPNRETWASQRAMAIQLVRNLPQIPEITQPIEGAPPRSGPGMVVWPSLLGLMLVMLGLISAYLISLPFPWR